MNKIYKGKDVCQGCGKSGAEVPRISKDELCRSCNDILKLGLSKDIELKQEYIRVSSWPTFLPQIDSDDYALSTLLRELLEGLHNPYAKHTQILHHPFNRANPHGSNLHTIPSTVVEPMKEFFDKIQNVIIDIRKEKENIPKLVKEAVQEEKNKIYNEGIQIGRNLLFQLNEGSITQEDFIKKAEYNTK